MATVKGSDGLGDSCFQHWLWSTRVLRTQLLVFPNRCGDLVALRGPARIRLQYDTQSCLADHVIDPDRAARLQMPAACASTLITMLPRLTTNPLDTRPAGTDVATHPSVDTVRWPRPTPVLASHDVIAIVSLIVVGARIPPGHRRESVHAVRSLRLVFPTLARAFSAALMANIIDSSAAVSSAAIQLIHRISHMLFPQ